MKIYPREKMYGAYEVPSDKQITHSAIVLGALAKGKTYIVRPLICSDIMQTVSCVKKLGAKVKLKGEVMEIRGVKGFKNTNHKFDCGNSAATMRLLCGVVAGSGITAVISGGKYLSKRSMKGVKAPLEKMGATVALTDYTVAPILVEGAKLRPIEYEMPAYSSHVKAATLVASLQGQAEVVIKENVPTDNYTEILMRELGAKISEENGKVTLKISELKGGNLYVCGDFHSACILLALGILLGEVTVKNVGINPRRTYFLEVLRRMGAKIEIKNRRLLCGEVIGDVTAFKSELRATHVTKDESCKIVDELPVLAVLMGLADGESMIVDVDEDCQDSVPRADYIKALINSVGGKCSSFDGGVLIRGVKKYVGGNVKTFGDHKIALAGAVALMASEEGGELDDENCISVSFPKFFETVKSHDIAVAGKGDISDTICDMNRYILKKLDLPRYGVSKLDLSGENPKRIYSELKNYKGISLYAPYNGEIIKFVPKLVGVAKFFKSLTTVTQGKGYSFDGSSTLLALRFIGEDIASKRVLVIGAGNAARSIIFSLGLSKAHVSVYNHDMKQVFDMVKNFKHGIEILDEIKDEKYDVIINATPVGSGYYEGQCPVGYETIKKSRAVVDLAVKNGRTVLIDNAISCGVKAVDGSSVAFFSAYLTCAVCFGKTAFEQEAFSLYADFLKDTEV